MGLQKKITLQSMVRDFKRSPAHAATLSWLANPATSNTAGYTSMVSSFNQFQYDISNNVYSTYTKPLDNSPSKINDLSAASTDLSASPVRVVVILPDGTVQYDSSKSINTNTIGNLGTNIGENHNSRQVFMKAFLGAQGTIAYESKYSRTDGKFEEGAAIALGADGESTLGAIRFTVLAPNTN